MYDPAQKCENYAIFKQNYTLELFISLKMAICCCFGLRGNLEFTDFLQKKFYNINYRTNIQIERGKLCKMRKAQREEIKKERKNKILATT